MMLEQTYRFWKIPIFIKLVSNSVNGSLFSDSECKYEAKQKMQDSTSTQKRVPLLRLKHFRKISKPPLCSDLMRRCKVEFPYRLLILPESAKSFLPDDLTWHSDRWMSSDYFRWSEKGGILLPQAQSGSLKNRAV